MKIKVGDEIFGKFGVGKITNIELCENIGDKEGIPMKEVWTNQVEKCVFDIDNGHFEYGLDIDYGQWDQGLTNFKKYGMLIRKIEKEVNYD